ncbi:hypothetical protein BDV10DRAFT_168611 [Aspergillus recurvatus]
MTPILRVRVLRFQRPLLLQKISAFLTVTGGYESLAACKALECTSPGAQRSTLFAKAILVNMTVRPLSLITKYITR